MSDEQRSDAPRETPDKPKPITPLVPRERTTEVPVTTALGFRPGVREYLNPIELARSAADRVVNAAELAISSRGRFTIALSGGQTPILLFELLASPEYASRIDWELTYVFWVDERCVPQDDRHSNFHLAREHLLQHVPVAFERVFRIEGELAPEEAAVRYEARLREFFMRRLDVDKARFDVLLLGMGADGHTASLIPGSPLLREQSRWVAATPQPYNDLYRVTLTYPALNDAALILMMVTGEEKANTVWRALRGPHDVNTLPAQGVQPDRGDLIWMLDRAAARLLGDARPE